MYNSTLEFLLGSFTYYAIFIFLIVLLVAKYIKWINDKSLLAIAGILLIIIAAFRSPGVDKDYNNYLYAFDTVSTPGNYFSHFNDWFFFEPLYYLIPSVFKVIFGTTFFSNIVFIVFACTSISLTFNAILKLSSFPELSIIHFFCYFFLLHEMTQIRAGVACGFLLLVVYYYYLKEYKKAILFFAIAFLFHYTSLLIFLCFFLNPKKFSLKLNLFILAVSIILAALETDIILTPLLNLNISFLQKMTAILNNMSEDQNAANVFNIAFFLNLFATVWLMINHKKIIIHNKFSYLLIKIQILSFVFYCLFSSVAVIAYRLSELFGIVNIITIPLLVYTFRSKWIGYLTIVIYSFILLVLNLQFVQVVEPYRTILLAW